MRWRSSRCGLRTKVIGSALLQRIFYDVERVDDDSPTANMQRNKRWFDQSRRIPPPNNMEITYGKIIKMQITRNSTLGIINTSVFELFPGKTRPKSACFSTWPVPVEFYLYFKLRMTERRVKQYLKVIAIFCSVLEMYQTPCELPRGDKLHPSGATCVVKQTNALYTPTSQQGSGHGVLLFPGLNEWQLDHLKLSKQPLFWRQMIRSDGDI